MQDFTQVLMVAAICSAVSYFICGIPFGLLLGEFSGHVDIRKAGSGNIGTTNALRVAGPKVAAFTLLLDCLKGAICVTVSRFVIAQVCFAGNAGFCVPGAPGDWAVALVALWSIWGHIFSPYLHFKGGKGIACGLGAILGWYWPIGLSLLGFFIIGVAITRYVSVGSLMAAIGLPIATICVFPYASLPLKVFMAFIGVTVVWAHRSNIKKLASGTESKLSFTKRVSKLDSDECSTEKEQR